MSVFETHDGKGLKDDEEEFREMKSDGDEKMERMETVLPFVPLP